jgi:pyruvate formate lyase activating enzyme
MSLTGLIFDIKHFSVNDGPGIRTTVFFKGCPLVCRWCHNPESRKSCNEKIKTADILDGRSFERFDNIGRDVTIDEIMPEIEKDIIFYETSGGGVTFSGGEPLLQPDFIISLSKACHDYGINTCLDTSGHCEQNLFKEIVHCFDLFLYDVKIVDPAMHLEWTGVDNSLILQNLQILDQSGKKYIIRVPLIPGVNVTTENTSGLIGLLSGLRFASKEVHLLPYHTLGKNKMKRMGLEYTMPENLDVNNEELSEISAEISKAGYTVKIGG